MRRILWFRRDLRVLDNRLLSQEGNVLPIFIFDTAILDKLSSNDRRMTFIFNALIRLKEQLKTRGLDLALFYGKPTEVFQWLLSKEYFDEVCASGDYDPYARERDRDVSHLLPFTYLHDTYIFRPDEVLKSDASAYLVFTPYYNRAKSVFRQEHMAESVVASQTLIPFAYHVIHRIEGSTHTDRPISLTSIGFSEQSLTSHQRLLPEEKLNIFAGKLANYSHDRDFMALHATSGLSTDLRFGTLSIRALLRWLAEQKKSGIDTEPFFRQLVFRDFYAMLLYHFPHLVDQNFRYPFRGIENNHYFEAFCTARTGVPIVDAGIRELLESGEMHNRVRMICASFLTKNLLLPWQWGERFFAQHLMDYDASSNILSWQWSAGTGVDPQPYFRIFNPYTQSAKFDKEGDYIKTRLPELSNLPSKLFSDEAALTQNVWETYPQPIVDHKKSSKQALDYFKSVLLT
ncbi:deoxyribodipyrimidine photo-lyase [Sulfuricurvum sp.]|uniref:cryptochrome/photolyase family protein n=1 Tax=Sulfuricurvum sp. TaxID=2025608 RepID=UPI00261B149E|nr:deoxyribodipyrimidine photo-lyase [Sulfuricurvum sp.]MDD2266692.1 deoxyribodipyrimidine photo-lyase [Sulfuricurvum sp.]MDD2784140.1 deoxyribodipyrimidine photo-lyase [Sulfuricurvum sp.]